MGRDYSSLPEEEKNFWTYYYFNAGIGAGERLLQEQGRNAFKKWEGEQVMPNQFGTQKVYTALLVQATTSLYSKLGIFNSLSVPTEIEQIMPTQTPTENSQSSSSWVSPSTQIPWGYNQ